VNWPSTKYEALEDQLKPLTSGLAATISSTATSIQVTSDEGAYIRRGQILLIDSEQIWVSSVSTDTATVTRSFGGTTNASHATSTTNVKVISYARVEGDDSTDSSQMTRTTFTNYTQIFQDEVKVSRSAAKNSQYGIANELDFQRDKKLPELMRMMEQQVFYGKSASGSSSTARAFGGLPSFVTLNTSSATSTALTQAILEGMLQHVWGDGGNPDLIICNGWGKRKINSFYENMVRTTRDERRGGYVIDEIDTDFGTQRILMSRWCDPNNIWVVTTEHLGFLEFDPFSEEPLAKTGDWEKRHLIGEYGFVCKHNAAHGLVYISSTT
jgi:hypothetical protein